jgi:excinuclease ABC subunit C
VSLRVAAHPTYNTNMDAPLTPAEKVKTFPQTPGVYLMKDSAGTVIYVGKAKNLRSRAGSYFTKEAAENLRTCELVKHIADIDFIPLETEVDALLKENRLIKDIRPKFNKDLKDGKSYPYLQIRVREEFPRVEITRTPRKRGVRLYGPFTNTKSLKAAVNVLQRVLKFRNCSLPIKSSEDRWRWFRPCLLASIRQCTAPCNFRVTREEYRKQIKKLILILEGKKGKLIRRMKNEMKEASTALNFEKAARIRDEVAALEKLEMRGKADGDDQHEVFHFDPKKGLRGLQKVLGLAKTPRSIEGFDIAHLSGQDTVASLVSFLDGLPFKDYYRRFKIKTVEGVDDFASMREVIFRRFKRLHDDESVFPDIILIDGGKGQLSAALDAFQALGIEPPTLISLAKQEEEIFHLRRTDEGLPAGGSAIVSVESESIKLSRHSAALRLLQYVRDESHRFAQLYHHTLRNKKFTQ